MRTWEGSSGLSNLRKDEATEVLNLLEETEESSVQLQLCYPRYWSQDSVGRVLQTPCHESNRWTILTGTGAQKAASDGTSHGPDLQWPRLQDPGNFMKSPGCWFMAHGRQNAFHTPVKFLRRQQVRITIELRQIRRWAAYRMVRNVFVSDFLGHSPSFNTYLSRESSKASNPKLRCLLCSCCWQWMGGWDGEL